MDWSRLPPLASLRAFETAARKGSFSAAGRELNVTHAAVVQQVRALERHLGMPLAFREGRGLALTAEGARLSAALTDGFGTIAAEVGALATETGSRPLKVTTTALFASNWLMPRLGTFWKAHPEIPVALHPDDRVHDLHRDGIDLAVRYGRGGWPGLVVEPFTTETYAIVAAPSLLQGATPAQEELQGMPWVLHSDWAEQRTWLASLGIETSRARVSEVPTEDLGLAAARAGHGLHVQTSSVIADDVAAGRLVEVLRGGPQDVGYFLCTRPGPVRPALRAFLRWLRSQV